jgi:hypothetical protein
MSEENKINDRSSDRKYFTIVPRIVSLKARNPYDTQLWITIKEIAGDGGECILSTEDLAVLSMMGRSKVIECRRHLIEVGLLNGEIRKDPGYSQPTYHLSIPDIWDENLEISKGLPRLRDRLKYKKQQNFLSFNRKGGHQEDRGGHQEDRGGHQEDRGGLPRILKEEPIEEPIEDSNILASEEAEPTNSQNQKRHELQVVEEAPHADFVNPPAEPNKEPTGNNGHLFNPRLSVRKFTDLEEHQRWIEKGLERVSDTEVQKILDKWNYLGITQEDKPKRHFGKSLRQLIQEILDDGYALADISLSFKTYKSILDDDDYALTYKWTITNFLNDQFKTFVVPEWAKMKYGEEGWKYK